MTRPIRWALLACGAAILSAVFAGAESTQGRGHHPPPPRPPRPHVAVRGHFVFIGGYFYDPFFGPYPWWSRPAYPHRYFPVYDYGAELRLLVTPREAAVYVDGFYAGAVDDFDGVFQALALPPGGHSVMLYLDGYRTSEHNLYLRPGSTLKLHDTMERLPGGVASVPPPVAPPVPMPPMGTYTTPRTPPPATVPPSPASSPQLSTTSHATGFGSLDVRVQPVEASLTIDGAPWVSSDPGHFVVQLSEGEHRVEATRPGYRRFSMQIAIRNGETTPLNVSLPLEKP